MRERRIELGLTQQQLAELIGVTYQQAHKYEIGINRISAGRLAAIAKALGVGVGYFFEGLASGCAAEPNAQQRLLLDLARDFAAIPNRKFQEAVCAMARVLAAVEPEAENGARSAKASRSRPMPASKAE
jgi:transcriptional regulator with XRE-family HTH domain